MLRNALHKIFKVSGCQMDDVTNGYSPIYNILCDLLPMYRIYRRPDSSDVMGVIPLDAFSADCTSICYYEGVVYQACRWTSQGKVAFHPSSCGNADCVGCLILGST